MDQQKYVYPKWDSSNDYSYSDLVSFEDDNSAAAITDKITLYADDKLIWGVEPDGTTPSADEPINVSNKNVNYGDADCDGVVTIADAVAVSRYLANAKKYPLTEAGKLNADCVDAGKGITADDVTAIQVIASGSVNGSDLPLTASSLKKITAKK